MTSELTIGIDIGTSSVKAVAADPDGRVVARSRIPHGLHVPVADQLEHDACEAWVRGVRGAVEALGPDVRAAALAAGVSAMVPSLTAVGADGSPLLPGLLYGDARGRVDGSSGSSPGDNREVMAFLDWCLRHAPDARGYWPAQTVAAVALGGDPVLDASTATTFWPLFDGTQWDLAKVAEVGVRPDQLPRLAPVGEVATRAGDLALVAGAVDALAEQVVCDAREPGDVVVMCGTTLMTWVLTDCWQPETAPLWCIPWHVPGRFVVGGPSNAGGLFLSWAQRLLPPPDPDPRLDPHAVPLWSPYPRGERVPLHDTQLRAGLRGLDLTMGPEAVRRAAYEAAGFVVADMLARAGLPARRIVATGGGTQVAGWVQALADCTGLPVHVPEVAEGAALGMAWMSRVGLGLESNLADASRWVRIARVVDPDPQWVKPCADRFAEFQAVATASAGAPT
jgi:xylulokinase